MAGPALTPDETALLQTVVAQQKPDKSYPKCAYLTVTHGAQRYAITSLVYVEDPNLNPETDFIPGAGLTRPDFEMWKLSGTKWTLVGGAYSMVNEIPDVKTICLKNHLPADVSQKFGYFQEHLGEPKCPGKVVPFDVLNKK
jgi:hypothetical protein